MLWDTALAYQAEAASVGRNLRLGEGVGAVRKIVLGETFEEPMEIATNMVGFWYTRYPSNFGLAEANRTDRDEPNKMVIFTSDRNATERMQETGQLSCGTPNDVRQLIEDLHACYGDGALDWIAWEFQTQGTYPTEEPQRELHLFATKVMPFIK